MAGADKPRFMVAGNSSLTITITWTPSVALETYGVRELVLIHDGEKMAPVGCAMILLCMVHAFVSCFPIMPGVGLDDGFAVPHGAMRQIQAQWTFITRSVRAFRFTSLPDQGHRHRAPRDAAQGTLVTAPLALRLGWNWVAPDSGLTSSRYIFVTC